ncbi:MAG: DUF2997 domain-containing protein [Candidatus Gastranaerophilales bacterium]|nr:DUF2997 domain-containing protein [Candidatus Gastranaerophilales bacterium]
MAKKIKIKISPNGELKIETQGIKGKKCEEYAQIIEKLADLKVVSKEYTDEYYEEEQGNITVSENL